MLLLFACLAVCVASSTIINPQSKLDSTNETQKDVDYVTIEEPDEELEVKQIEHPKPSKSDMHKVIGPNVNLKNAGVITNMSDIVKMVRFVLLRGHIVLDASHKVIVRNESRIDRLLNYLHEIQLRRGKNRILPFDDRDLACDVIPNTKIHLKALCKAATFDCLSASDMMHLLPRSITFHQAVTRICPLLLFRQSRPICVADAKKLLDQRITKKIELVEPSIERVWGFGVLFVTISILVSMGGLIVLPFLKKSSRTTILTFFEGLAVGGLSVSIVHLSQ